MAAILCESLSKILKGGCEVIGTVLTLPCKACGMANGQLANLCRSPFCLYLTVAMSLNIPPIVFTGKSIAWSSHYGGYGSADCQSASNWLVLNAWLSLINILAALYISAKITYEFPEEDNEAPFIKAEVIKEDTTKASSDKPKLSVMKSMKNVVLENTLDSSHTRPKSMARVKDVLCYDPVIAIYIIIGIFFMIWQSVGINRRLAADCGGSLQEYLSNSLLCGWLFIMVGGMTFGCSFCCLGRSR